MAGLLAQMMLPMSSELPWAQTASITAGAFVILGAGLSGSGAAHTLGKLGSVNEIAGSFIVALAAAVTVYWMTRLKLPASTSQAIVGAIIGWNIFSGSITDYGSLIKIIMAWVFSPLFAAVFAMVLYFIINTLQNRLKIHLLWQDVFNRIGLIVVGAFGAYSLGANNIANVMGVFVPVAPFKPIDLNFISISGAEQLFILGGIAIAIGIYTYSYRVMTTVGNQIFKLTPLSALVVVLSSSLVLFLFASEGLQHWLASNGLPSIPLVPLSSSQVVVGGVLGIGFFYGGKNINFKVLGKIASGWITVPIIAGLISFTSLFFLQNVFNQKVFRAVNYSVTNEAYEKLTKDKVNTTFIENIKNRKFINSVVFKNFLMKTNPKAQVKEIKAIIERSQVHPMKIDINIINRIKEISFLTDTEQKALIILKGKAYTHKWQLKDDLSKLNEAWRFKKNTAVNKNFNKTLRSKLDYLCRIFLIKNKK
ncbi:inorganic phosphate transporter [Spirochaetota bacterium]